MFHTNNPIIKHKAGLLNLAEELGNVSKACQVMGVSRDTFYRYQELVDEGGLEALISKSRRTPNLKNRVDLDTEKKCSGLMEPDTLIRDNNNQLLRCQNGTETNIQTIF